jgi:NAD(P)-dependent dehydrogenase (short-subunit alcohol dehydrogenase family)
MWTALNRPRCQGGAPAAQRARTTLTTGPRGSAHPRLVSKSMSIGYVVVACAQMTICSRGRSRFPPGWQGADRHSRGSVMNIASLSADRAAAGIVPYRATKAASIQLCTELGRPTRSHSLLVNTVAPGYIESPITSDVLGDEEARALEPTPLRRFTEGDDLVDVVLFGFPGWRATSPA